MRDIILFQTFLQSLGVEHITIFFSFGKSHKDIELNNFTEEAFYEVILKDKQTKRQMFFLRMDIQIKRVIKSLQNI